MPHVRVLHALTSRPRLDGWCKGLLDGADPFAQLVCRATGGFVLPSRGGGGGGGGAHHDSGGSPDDMPMCQCSQVRDGSALIDACFDRGIGRLGCV